jgi:hypothetical protein
VIKSITTDRGVLDPVPGHPHRGRPRAEREPVRLLTCPAPPSSRRRSARPASAAVCSASTGGLLMIRLLTGVVAAVLLVATTTRRACRAAASVRPRLRDPTWARTSHAGRPASMRASRSSSPTTAT